MPDQDVSIQYNAVVTGMGNVADLAKANNDLQQQTAGYTNKTKEATAAQEKHKNALLQAHSAVRQFHRELFVAAGVIGLVTFALSSMAKGSESAAIGLDQITNGITKGLGAMSDYVAKSVAFWGAVSGGSSFDQAHKIADSQIDNAQSLETRARLAGMAAKLAQTQGDDLLAIQQRYNQQKDLLEKSAGDKSYEQFKIALDKQYEVDVDHYNKSLKLATMAIDEKTAVAQGDNELAFQIKQQSESLDLQQKYHGQSYAIRKAALDKEQAAEKENFRLSEMGLKTHMEIMNDFKKDLIGGAFQGSTESVLEKMLSGQHQTPKEMLQTFQSGIAKAVASALSQSLWSGLMGGGGFGDIFTNIKNALTGRTPQVVATEKVAKSTEEISNKNNEMIGILRQIAECVCSTAQSVGGKYSMNIDSPKQSGIQRALSFLSPIASLSSLGGLFGGGGAPSPAPAPVVDFSAAYLPKSHSGGPVGTYASGGEIPIMAQQGEFVVRKSVAEQNKGMLRDLNSGGKPVGGTTNVFLIKANDANSFVSMLSSPSAQAQIEIQVIKSIMGNGNIRGIIKDFAK